MYNSRIIKGMKTMCFLLLLIVFGQHASADTQKPSQLISTLVLYHNQRCLISSDVGPKVLSQGLYLHMHCLAKKFSCAHKYVKTTTMTALGGDLVIYQIRKKICGSFNWFYNPSIRVDFVSVTMWHITVRPEWYIRLHIHYFALPFSDACIGSRMDITKSNQEVLKRYCGFKRPFKVFTRHHEIIIFILWGNERKQGPYTRVEGIFESLLTVPDDDKSEIGVNQLITPLQKLKIPQRSKNEDVYKYLVRTNIQFGLQLTTKVSGHYVWSVYDGPDSTFPMFDTTTLSSGIFLYIEARVINGEVTVHFESIQNTNSSTNCTWMKTEKNSKITLSLEAENIKMTLCRTWLSQKMFAKLHIDNFYTLAPQEDCLFWGLSVGFQTSELIMLNPLCRSYRRQVDPYFISPNQKLLVIVYAYYVTKISLQLSIKNERQCPGLPLICQSDTLHYPLYPPVIEITNVVKMEILGDICQVFLLSSRCVHLFKFIHMDKCSEVNVKHFLNSSFKTNKLVQPNHNKWLIASVNYPVASRCNARVQADVTAVGEKQPKGIVMMESNTFAYGSIYDLKISQKLGFCNSPKMWHLTLEPTKCIFMNMLPSILYFFRDKCAQFSMGRPTVTYIFEINVAQENYINFETYLTPQMCSVMCNEHFRLTIEEDLSEDPDNKITYLFTELRWNIKWKTMRNKATFKLSTHDCIGVYLCRQVFHYRSVKQPSLQQPINTNQQDCRIGSSVYNVVYNVIADNRLSWNEAKLQCQNQHQSQLISINSRQEITDLMLSSIVHQPCKRILFNLWTAQTVFIGLTRLRRGSWVWESEEPLSFSDWGSYDELTYLYPKVFINKFEKIQDAELSARSELGHTICTGMNLFNQHSSSNWMSVQCNKEYVNGMAICEKKDPIKTTTMKSTSDPTIGPTTMATISPDLDMYCINKWTYSSKKCYRLLYQGRYQNPAALGYDFAMKLCINVGGQGALIDVQILPALETLLDLWKSPHMDKEDIWIGRSLNSSQCPILKTTNRLKISESPCNGPTKPVLVLCESESLNSKNASCPQDMFACNDGSCIASFAQCDLKKDCHDGEDELACQKASFDFGFIPCKNNQLFIPINRVCDQKNECGEEEFCHRRLSKCPVGYFKCKDGSCIMNSRVCDQQYDCIAQEDEKGCSAGIICSKLDCKNCNISNRIAWLTKSKCPNKTISCELYGPDYSQCSEDEGSMCYPRHRRCIRDLDFNGTVLFCSGKQHLQNCENFECSGYFKCPGSFCIPFGQRCNGHNDCPGAEDEMDCENYFLPHGIQCPVTRSLVHKSDWCNGINDCSYGEDERNCEPCPFHCTCTQYVTKCKHAKISLKDPHFTEKMAIQMIDMNLDENSLNKITANNIDLIMLDLSNNRIEDVSLNFLNTRLAFLKLDKNNIRQIPTAAFAMAPFLNHLSLIGNPVETIGTRAFWGLMYMAKLNLSYLSIAIIEDDAFEGMISLRQLNLSHNNIQHLTVNTFMGLFILNELDLSKNPLYMIDKNTFQYTESLVALITPAFKYCCAAEHVDRCLPEPDEFSSCSDLMANSVLKASIWVLAFSTFLGNIAVILWRRKQENPSVLSFLVQHLGFADMLMGLYLLIIALADFYYRGHYYLWDDYWRQSAFCKIAGFLSMWSSEMSVFVLLIIVIDRVNVVGLARPGMGEKIAFSYIVFGWIVFACLSILPIAGLAYFGSGKYIKNGACFLFNITEGKVAGWEYATAIFIIFNTFVLATLICGYTFTFISVVMKTGFQSNMEGKVARKLTLVVLTDCICWIPPITIGIMSLQGIAVNPQIAVWVAVFVFPLNSTINPFLYTFSAMKCDDKNEDEDPASDGYVSHIQPGGFDAESLSECHAHGDDDLARPSTSSAVKDEKSQKRRKRKSTRCSKRGTIKGRSLSSRQGNTNTQQGQVCRKGTKGVAYLSKPAYEIDSEPATSIKDPLEDIPEVGDNDLVEDETNVQISVSVAIKHKGGSERSRNHKRTQSSSKASQNQCETKPFPQIENGYPDEEVDSDHDYELLTTARFNTTLPEEGNIVAIEMSSQKSEEAQ